MKIGVLGGGLVGLVVASRCKSHDCEVLEADEAIGGHCRSLIEDGYTFDPGGPHILFSKNQEMMAIFREQLGDNISQRTRNNKIWYQGRYVKYPFENGLYDLTPEDRFECLYHYLKNDYPPPKNFKEWIYHVFGKGIAEKYLLPYNEKIWNVPAEKMGIDWVDGRVPRPPIEDVIKSAVGVVTEGYTHQLYFLYPKTGGIEALPRSFAKDCANITLNFRIEKVWREKEKWRVSNGKITKSYDKLVTTIPIDEMIEALPDVPEDIRTAVHKLQYNSLIVVMIGVETDTPIPYTAIYIPDPSIVTHRISFPLNFTDEGAPPGHVAIAAEITTNPGDGIHELSDKEVSDRIIADLEKMELVDRSKIRFCKIFRTKHAYVVRTFDYLDNLSKVLEYINGLGIISVGRNSEFEYINMDEALRRALEAVKKIEAEGTQ